MKPIKITEQNKEELLAQFKKYLNDAKLSDNTISFSTKLLENTVNAEKATIKISTKAYVKMLLYIRDTQTEIAWHGIVHKNNNEYFISDVFLYPQKLSAATVNTDQAKYNEWIENLDDETYNHLKFQGHSHVNFGATPSGTDFAFYDSILQVLTKSDFYIFMIMNKSGSCTFLIYDLAQNIIYENNDINLILGDENENIFNTIELEKEYYCEKPVYQNTTYAGHPYANTPYHQQYGAGSFYQQSFDDYTETDRIFDDIDARFKNSQLKAPKGKGKKK